MRTSDPKAIFLDRLRRVHRRTLWRVAGLGVARLGLGGAMVLATLWLLGLADGPGRFLTYGLLVSLAMAVGALLWTQLLGRLWRLRTRRQLVRHLERQGSFANLLVAAEEAVRDPARWEGSRPVTRELRARLLRQAAERLRHVGPADAAPWERRGQTILGLALCLVLATFLATAPGGVLERGWRRFLNPALLWAPPPTGGLLAEVTSGHVVFGETMPLQALDATLPDANLPEDAAVCEIRVGTGMWQPVPTRRGFLNQACPAWCAPLRVWQAEVQDVREDFQWRFRRGAMVSRVGRVQVRHYPLVTELAGTIAPPAYTRLADREMPRLPTWLEAPANSRLILDGRTNHPPESVHLVADSGDSLALAVAGSTFQGTLEIMENQVFQLVVRDAYGLRNRAPLRYEVVAVPDGAPAVHLGMKGDDSILPVDGRLDLQLDAADDYGLTALGLEMRVLAGTDISAGPEEGPDFRLLTLWRGDAPLGAGQEDWSTPWGAAGLVFRPLAGTDSAARQPLQAGLALETGFGDLDLMPGDVLELRALARDNRRPGPAGESRSSVLRLSLPSAADVLAAQADSSAQRQGELDEMRRRGRQLGQDLDRLTRELLKNPVPDWARQQEMEAALERQKRMQQELSRVARQLMQDLERLASGQMTSEKMLEKAEQIGELLQQPSSESLAEALRKMQQDDAGFQPEELAEAMRDVARDQKEMARRLDAALSMLQTMDREQELEGLASLLEKMIRKQQELADLSREQAAEDSSGERRPEGGESEGEQSEGEQSEGEQSENGQSEGQQSENQPGGEQPSAEELARRQEALAQEMEQLREKLEQALAELQEQDANDGRQDDPGSEEMRQALEQALKQMEQKDSQGSMDQAGEQLAQMNPEMAAQLQEQALRDLGSLYHVILKTQSAMQAAMDNRQTSSLRRLAADMLTLSGRQEAIAERIPARIREVRSLDLTRGQHRVQLAAIGARDRLSDLTGQNPNRIMRLLEDLDGIIETMGEALRGLQENRAGTARKAASGSLGQTNRLVISLLTEAQMSSSSAGGSGEQQQQQMSLSEQLKSMAKDQAELNALTEQMRQMLANRGLSQQTRAQMKRLGESQGELAGRMRELDEEVAGRPDGERLLGDLGALGDLMETIGQEVESGLVSEETLIRQERILSRMLDARNSVRQRDYSSRRESRTAERLYDPESGRLGQDGAGGPDDPFDLRYQPLEKAPQEYRHLVRKYFQALEELRRQMPSQPPSQPQPREVP